MQDIKNNYYAILDFDGFVCKSFYANNDDPMNPYLARNILRDLTSAAVEKTAAHFGIDKDHVKVLPIMSGHSWKKDIYPSYKRKRKKDDFLGAYRDIIKQSPSIITIPQLEADEVIVMLSDYLTDINCNNYIVFSDDKDLKYYTPNFCRINITEEITINDTGDIYTLALEQMLAGDGEDSIKGIPNVGMKTAQKLLSIYGYDLMGVIQCYKDKGIDIDACLRDLLLIIPLSEMYREETEEFKKASRDILKGDMPLDWSISQVIISQIQYLNKKVKEVYNKDEKSKEDN